MLSFVALVGMGASSISGDRCDATDFGGHHCSAGLANLTSVAITTGLQVRVANLPTNLPFPCVRVRSTRGVLTLPRLCLHSAWRRAARRDPR